MNSVIDFPIQQDIAPQQVAAPQGPLDHAATAVQQHNIAEYLAAVLMATPPKNWPTIIEQFDTETFTATATLLAGTHLGNLTFHLAAAYDHTSLQPAAMLTLIVLDWEAIARTAAEFMNSGTSDTHRRHMIKDLRRQELELLRHEVAMDRRCKYRWIKIIDQALSTTSLS